MAKKRSTRRGGSARSSDLPIDPHLDRMPERQRRIAAAVREEIAKRPDVTESLDWGLPVFKTPAGRVCYLKSFPTHLHLGFWQGAGLPDPDSLLQGTTDTMRHVRLTRVEDVESKSFRALLRAAFEASAG